MRDSIPSDMRSKYPVQCFPLYSLILAMGRPKIDFLSLDIEGAELAVLNTIPWDKVEIELVMLEVLLFCTIKKDQFVFTESIPCALSD